MCTCNSIKVLPFVLFVLTHVNAKIVIDTLEVSPDTIVLCSLITSDRIDVYTLKNGEKHGSCKSFYSSGKLKTIRKYNGGCQYDSSYMYFETGNISSLSFYKNCKREGKSVSFAENGDTVFIAEYRDGKRVGTTRSWYKNGHLKEIIHYNKDGEKHGVRQRWYKNGNCRDSMVYDNGLPYQGIEYYENGNKRAWYKKGYIDWDARGIKFRHVETITYTPEGKKLSHIKKGNGLYRYYLDDGRCMQNQVVDGEEGPMPQPCNQ